MVFPKKYQTQATALANYDYTDIASGTGYSVFYGGNSYDGSVSGAYLIANNTFYSANITTTCIIGNTLTGPIEMDFDTQFNLPRTIKGKVIVNVPFGIGRKDAETGGTATGNISGAVIHYDGTTETVLGEFRTDAFTVDDDVVTINNKTLSGTVEISETDFKKGDYLRINLRVWGKTVDNIARWMGIGHDPKNSEDPATTAHTTPLVIYDSGSSTYGNTIMEVHVPFKLDL